MLREIVLLRRLLRLAERTAQERSRQKEEGDWRGG
jgi:hypothetical protein